MPAACNTLFSPLYGSVVCGGMSSRMGTDKSMLVYHDEPERYRMLHLLEPFCNKVFISCNREQEATVPVGINCITDLPRYAGSGPVAALLSFFSLHPGRDLLVAGCDYPFFNKDELERFIQFISREKRLSAFYDRQAGKYEPLLAYYPSTVACTLKALFEEGNYSLQHLLLKENASKYLPSADCTLFSVNTPEDREKALMQLNRINKDCIVEE